MLYFYYMCVSSCRWKDYVIYMLTQQNKKSIIWSACLGDCWLQFLILAFICYIMVVSISMDSKRKKMVLIKTFAVML